MAFPLASPPAWYTNCIWRSDATLPRNGVFNVGDTVTVKFGSSGADTYTVRDYYGNIVSSGSVTGTSVQPTPPAGGWKCGWYRIYLTGPNTDTNFGHAYSSTNFCVIQPDSRFLPAQNTTYANNGGPNGWWNEQPDFFCKGFLGMGTHRFGVGDVTSLATGDTLTHAEADAATAASYWTTSGYLDPVRTRYLWAVMATGANVDYDSLAVPSSSGTFVTAYCKDGTIDGTTTFVSIGAGSVSGAKIVVYSPNNSTVVETYDNLATRAAAQTTINAASAYIRVYAGGGTDTNGTLAATAIGNTHWAGVGSVVSGLYPLGVTRFEGPSNEPDNNGLSGAEVAQQMRLFQAAVHAGNAAAKAIGPCTISIGPSLTFWKAFLAAGGANYCDEISFHAYNVATSGDINLGRTILTAFTGLLANYGLSSVPLWQTESTHGFVAVYGVYHPRRARLTILQTLLMEQYGIPRERNNPWYDTSHGFWTYPAWWEASDYSLQPQPIMYRTLAAQTWGMTHQSTLDFGTPGNYIFLGSVYASGSAKTVVIMATSALPGATVTLAGLTGSSVTVTDAFGNQSTVTVNNVGHAVVPVAEIPTYVSVPITDTPTVYTINDWPPIKTNGQGADLASLSVRAPRVGTVLAPTITAGGFITDYGNQVGIFKSTNSPPEAATLTWERAARVDRVIIWAGSSWQTDSAPLTFTVDTSVDGSAWITQKTVDVSAGATAFLHGSSSGGEGCQYETYWPEQWVFDVKLPAPVTLKALRVNVTATSLGGEPASPINPATQGQGDSNQHVVLQRIACLCDATTVKEYLQ